MGQDNERFGRAEPRIPSLDALDQSAKLQWEALSALNEYRAVAGKVSDEERQRLGYDMRMKFEDAAAYWASIWRG